MEDIVNHPPHYTRGGIECIDAMEASMPPWEFRGYLKGSAFKYLWRYEDKGLPDVDLGKCGFYLDRLSKHVKDHPLDGGERGYSSMNEKPNETRKPSNTLSKDLITIGIHAGILLATYAIGRKQGFRRGVVAGSMEVYQRLLSSL